MDLPSGTRIFLTKRSPYTDAPIKTAHELAIRPDTTIINDSLFVLYDVRIGGRTIIPKGTRVTCNWVTESSPTVAAQLQATAVHLGPCTHLICATSDVFSCTTRFNLDEVGGRDYFYTVADFKSTSGIRRRIIQNPCSNNKVLADQNLDTIYLIINTCEISVFVQ